MTQPGRPNTCGCSGSLVRDRKAGKQRLYGLDAGGCDRSRVDRRVRAVLNESFDRLA